MKKKMVVFLILALALMSAAPAFSELPKAPVRIGVVLPISGAIAYDGTLALNGVKMAVDEINKAGEFPEMKSSCSLKTAPESPRLPSLPWRSWWEWRRSWRSSEISEARAPSP